jgi:replicative DNA helicase
MSSEANIDNEMVIIANLLFYPDSKEYILARTQDDDYLYGIHTAISQTARDLSQKGIKLEKDAIVASAKSLGFGDVEFSYLDDLEKGFTEKSENLDNHIQILKLDKLKHKFKIEDTKDIIKLISRPGYNVEELKNKLYETYVELLDFESGSAEEILKPMSTVVERYREEYALRRSGEGFYTTGFAHLDKQMMEGLAPKKITVVAARPGCGKSSFVYEVARRLANRDECVYIFSLEMEDYDIMDKYLSNATGIPIDKLVKNTDQLSTDEQERLEYELQRYSENEKVYISDRSGLSLATIGNQIQKLILDKKHKNVKVIIDLFGQISDFGTDSGLAQQYEIKLDKVKAMCKELGIHAILVNQINRGAERSDKSEKKEDDTSDNHSNPVYKNRPVMSMLKNSGKWEEVADNIFLLFRGKYYDESMDDDILEVFIAKQRKGSMNVYSYFEFIPQFGRIMPTAKLPYDKRDIGAPLLSANPIRVGNLPPAPLPGSPPPPPPGVKVS